jgi:hypothetical protein
MTTLTPFEYEMILRRDFASFIERSFYEINPGKKLFMAKYIDLMASRLEACRQGKIKRLILCVPPRYLKSHCVSVAFVAWLLGHNPATQIISASYAQPLASKHALECRTLMLSPFYRRLFRTRLSPDKQAMDDFMTTNHGFRMATSVGGVLTGRGADFIIIDDALKPEEALSETQRTNVNRWFDNTLLSRLNNKANGCIIIVMQRLHQDDLVGHVLEQDTWEVLTLPAIAERDEEYLIESPLGSYRYCRRTGEALHPERESLEELNVMCHRIGTYDFAAVVVIVGENTKNLYRFVRWEIQLSIDKDLPIIVTNLNGIRTFDANRCPPILRDHCAIHVMFKMKIIKHALDGFVTWYNGSNRDSRSGWRYYTDDVYTQIGLGPA